MANPKQAGFTLVELVIVMAITGSLALIAFIGQRGVRSRAQFDAAIDRVVATVADARNQATSGVNIVGAGDGTGACGGGPAGEYVFAGVAWSADNAVSGPIKLDYYKGLPGSSSAYGACIFQTQVVSLPSTITVTTPTGGGRVLFTRTVRGGLNICPVGNLTAPVIAPFRDGSCTPGSITFTFTDADGHSSQVLVDGSGLAKRLN